MRLLKYIYLFILLLITLAGSNEGTYPEVLDAKPIIVNGSEVQFVVVRLDYTTFDIIGYYEFSQPLDDSFVPADEFIETNNLYHFQFWNLDAGWTSIIGKLTSKRIIFASQSRTVGSFLNPPDSLMKTEFVVGSNNVMPNTITNIYNRDGDLFDFAWEKVWETDILEDISNSYNYEVYMFSHSYAYSLSEWFIIAHSIPTEVGIESENHVLPNEYSLSQNYPNPFNPNTAIEYSLPQSGEASLIVYNLIGQEVARLINGEQNAGFHIVNWDASHMASGVYFYRLQASPTSVWRAGDFVQTKKMVLLK